MIMRNIIRLIAPESINGYMLLPLKSVGLYITDTGINATVVLLSGKSIFIEKTIQENFLHENESFIEKVKKALPLVMSKIGPYHKLTSVISTSYTTFKELEFPFNNREKIEPTLIYKLESALPFQLQDLNIDFIITDQNELKTETYVTACALQTKQVNDHLQLLTESKVEPSAITLDSLCLYGLYTYLKNNDLDKCTVLVTIKTTQLILTVLENKRFAYNRSLSIAQFKVERIIQEIEFILTAYLDNTQRVSRFDKIVIMHDSHNIAKSFEEKFGITVTFFNDIFSKKSTFVSSSPEIDYTTLAAALPILTTSMFDINTKLDYTSENKLTYAQMIVGSCLALFIVGALFTHVFLQLSKLSKAYNNTKTEILTTLKREFPTINTNNIDDLLMRAQKEVKTEEAVWSSFSTKTRQSYLEYIRILSQKIDREALGLSLSKMMINKKTITLEGKVKNYDAVSQLQRQLQDTGLFSAVPDLQKTDFSVSLPLEQQGG